MRTIIFLLAFTTISFAEVTSSETSTTGQALPVWPDLAPGETSRETGETLPFRKNEQPPISRVINIRRPMMAVFPATNPNGVGMLILPGGGFGKVVPDMEGSEAALILNELGITCFVLSYRTKLKDTDLGWKRPLQDAQRAMAMIRANAKKWKLDANKIGLFGFSAGGQVAARLMTDAGQLSYEKIDSVDDTPHRPDFGILIYPWNMYDKQRDQLQPEIKVTADVPPTFIVHTNDDASTSLGSVLFYVGLKKAGVDSELHIYRNGGHGYGTRSRPDSDIGTWPHRMVDWLKNKDLGRE